MIFVVCVLFLIMVYQLALIYWLATKDDDAISRKSFETMAAVFASFITVVFIILFEMVYMFQ